MRRPALALAATLLLSTSTLTGCGVMDALPIPNAKGVPGVGGVSQDAGSLTMDGKAVPGPYTVTCTKMTDSPIMGMTAEASKDYDGVVVTITLNKALTAVESVGAVLSQKEAVLMLNHTADSASQGTSASLSKSGDDYTITGKALLDGLMTEGGAKLVSYEVKANCRM